MGWKKHCLIAWCLCSSDPSKGCKQCLHFVISSDSFPLPDKRPIQWSIYLIVFGVKKNRMNHLMNLKSKRRRNVTFCVRTNGQRRENEVIPGGCSLLPAWLCWQAVVAKHSVIREHHVPVTFCHWQVQCQWFKAPKCHFSPRECAQPPLWYSMVQGHLTMVLKYSNVLNCLGISGPVNPKFSFA